MKDQRMVAAFLQVALTDLQRQRREVRNLEDKVASWFSELLPDNQSVARDWMAQRGIDVDVIHPGSGEPCSQQ